MDDREYVNAYFIKETQKAILVELQRSGVQLWVPKSVIHNIELGEAPPSLEGKLPGRPALLRVAPWFRRKYPGAFRA